MINRIVCNDLFYFNFDDFSHVMRSRVTLRCDGIDGRLLYDAVQRAAARYPYFCKKIIRHGEEYEIAHNDAPIPVNAGSKPVLLGSGEAGGHLLSVSYVNRTIIFDISHNLTDGKGLMEWVKTVVYLYLTEVLDKPLAPDGIRLPGEDYLPGETADPYEDMDLDGARPVLPDKGPVDAFIPDDRYTASAERSNYVFTASENDLMRLAGSQDGSPASVLAYFSKEMLRELHPDGRRQTVVCSIPHSFRAIASGEANYHPQTILLHVMYDERMDAMPMDRQLTCTRGSIALQSDPDNVRYMLRQRAEFNASLDDVETIDERRRLYHDGIQLIVNNPETLAVSYIGRIAWGATEEYIEDITVESAAISAPVMFGFVPLNGCFRITMVLDRTADIYVKTLVRLLNEHGIASEYLYTYKQELCKVYLP